MASARSSSSWSAYLAAFFFFPCLPRTFCRSLASCAARVFSCFWARRSRSARRAASTAARSSSAAPAPGKGSPGLRPFFRSLRSRAERYRDALVDTFAGCASSASAAASAAAADGAASRPYLSYAGVVTWGVVRASRKASSSGGARASPGSPPGRGEPPSPFAPSGLPPPPSSARPSCSRPCSTASGSAGSWSPAGSWRGARSPAWLEMDTSSSRNSTPNPMMRGAGGRKFFLPRIMNEPVAKYSPVGAVLETWCQYTHHADVTILESQAELWHTQNVPAWLSVAGGTGDSASGFLMMQLEAPCRSACT
mmetsp:Transcript_4806/g.13451  ORF Transcript_4806/g.13451 Transcript_4806/m.13451 type:complete len:309 (-) Transcript_4806:313-1239(-)